MGCGVDRQVEEGWRVAALILWSLVPVLYATNHKALRGAYKPLRASPAFWWWVGGVVLVAAATTYPTASVWLVKRPVLNDCQLGGWGLYLVSTAAWSPLVAVPTASRWRRGLEVAALWGVATGMTILAVANNAAADRVLYIYAATYFWLVDGVWWPYISWQGREKYGPAGGSV